MRQLSLHVSALNNDEYDFFTSSLNDLVNDGDDTHEKCAHDDAYYESITVGVREARAWLRGRYSTVPVSDIDTILKFFHPNLGQTDALTGGQFFAALRLVLHTQGGKAIDSGLAFVQAFPASSDSRPPSPPKKRFSQFPPPTPPRPESPLKRQSFQYPPPPPTPVRRQTRDVPPSSAPASDTNPFTHLPPSVDVANTLSSSTPTLAPSSNTHNPFLARARSLNAGNPASIPAESKSPPLPPRKPPSLAPPPRHASHVLAGPPASVNVFKPPVPVPAFSSSMASIKTVHVTSPLMRQSLQASKAAQTMKKAEEQLERERVLQVLKSSSSVAAGRMRSSSPTKHPSPPVSSGSDERVAPPLPRRRKPSPAPSMTRSLEEVAGATVSPYHSAYVHPALHKGPKITTSPFSTSPTHTTIDLPPPPPTHPDLRRSYQLHDDTEHVLPPTPTSPRAFRSKSMHHNTPPPVPPPRRKRPESVQLVPFAMVPNSAAFPSPQLKPSGPRSATTHGLTRRTSLSSTYAPSAHTVSSTYAPSAHTVSDTSSALAGLQRTFAGLQPKLDAARYKAEAGLSRRGFVSHAGGGRWGDEGETGLMAEDGPRRRRWRGGDDGADVDVDVGVDQDRSYGTVTDDDPSSEEERTAARLGRRNGFRDADNLKWPVGEGWKPL